MRVEGSDGPLESQEDIVHHDCEALCPGDGCGYTRSERSSETQGAAAPLCSATHGVANKGGDLIYNLR